MTGPLKLGNNADIRFDDDNNILKKDGTDLVLGNNVLGAVIASSEKPVWLNGESVKNEIALKSDIQAVQQKNTQQDTSIASLQSKLEKALFLENPNA